MRSVLVIAYRYLPENTSGVQRIRRLSKYLPESGYQAHIVCGNPHGVTEESEYVRHAPKPGFEERQAAGMAKALSVLEPVTPIPYLTWLPHAAGAALEVIEATGAVAIISSSPPAVSHLAALGVREQTGLPWIADLRDPLIGNPTHGAASAGWDHAMEPAIVNAANAVTVTTDVMAEQLSSRYPHLAHKFHVIWNGFDPEETPAPSMAERPRPYRVLTHAGMLYFNREPGLIADGLHRLMSAGNLAKGSIRLRLIGQVMNPQKLYQRASAVALLQHGVLEADGRLLPREQALQAIVDSDYLLLLDLPTSFGGAYAVPAKLYDYALAGRPILALTQRNSPVERLLRGGDFRHECVYFEDLPAEVDNKLLRFFELSPEPKLPNSWFLENFNGRSSAMSFGALLDSLTGTSGG